MPAASSSVPSHPLRAKLARGQVVASMSVRLVASTEIVALAARAGIDTLYVDLQHGALTIDDARRICRAAGEAGLTPLIRVAENTAQHIAAALGAGAAGVIAPDVRSAEAAQAIVGHARLARATAIVVPMIESRAAVAASDAIAAVDGVDILFIGSNDLTHEMGITRQFDHQSLRDAYRHVIGACTLHGKYAGVGGLSDRPDLIAEFVRQGARYVSGGADGSFLLAAAGERATFIHALATDAGPAGKTA